MRMLPQGWVEVTSWLLVDDHVHCLHARPWALAAALAHLRDDCGARSFSELHMWSSASPMGWRFRRLNEVQWTLVNHGALVVARRIDGGCFVVDPWWQNERRSQLPSLDGDARKAVLAASSYLASLCATRVTPSKTARVAASASEPVRTGPTHVCHARTRR